MAADHESLSEHCSARQVHRADMEREDPATTLTREVMVVPLPGSLVQRFAVHGDGVNLALFGQQLQGAVHRGNAQTRQSLLRPPMDFRHA